jgi:hypothetical protein
MVDPKDPRVTTTKGPPGPDVQPGPAPGPIDPQTGQHTSYWVLTEEERAKGFVAPVRRSYVHVGERPKYQTRPLTPEEQERYVSWTYVAYEKYPEGSPEAEAGRVGRFWTQEQLDSGCGAKTTMSQALAETYARDPSFYGATFCSACRNHFPVAEFVWDGTDIVVGTKPEDVP